MTLGAGICVSLTCIALSACTDNDDAPPIAPAVRSTLDQHTTSEEAQRPRTSPAATSGCADDPPVRGRFPRTFFPLEREGLWLATPRSRCVYLYEAGSPTARPVWRVEEGQRARHVQWSPAGTEFVVVSTGISGGRVEVIDRRTLTVRSAHPGTAAAYLLDGRLAVLAGDRLVLASAGQRHALASTASLAQVAGFPGRPLIGRGSGYGRGHVAVVWLGRDRQQVMLVVASSGSVARASPVYGHDAPKGWLIGGLGWSPDGRALYQMPDVPPPQGSPRDHEHCLDRWTAADGWKRLTCLGGLSDPRFQFHYSSITWSRSGNEALLDNGSVITRSGAPLRIAANHNGAFSIHWAPHAP